MVVGAGYYSHPKVRQRMREYIEGSRYICANDPGRGGLFEPRFVRSLPELLLEEGEIYRSLWDEHSLLAVLDLEYVEFQQPKEVYQQPEPAFLAQAPVLDCLLRILEEHDLRPCLLMTGRGYHLTWRLPRQGPAFEQLRSLGEVSPGLERLYSRRHRPLGKRVSLAKALAFHGLGMVLEFLGHELLRRCPASPTPLRLAEVQAVGSTSAICLDLSCFGDPLHRRTLRVPFSFYGKARKFGYDQPIVCLPTQGLDLAGLLKMRANPQACAGWAGQAATAIPGGEQGTLSILRAYRSSRLAEYHQEFYEHRHQERTYPLTSLDSLPACIRGPLETPNDRLLKPAVMQNLVRCLVTQGWRGAEVCRLILSRFEQDHDWLEGVHFHEAGCRAEFYSRLFGGLMDAGHDRLEDFDCGSTRYKGLCPGLQCAHDLSRLRERWLSVSG